MDRIYLNQMEFYGYHGVFAEENKLGQKFIIDVILEIDLQAAGETDNLMKTINYAEVYSICQTIVENKTFKLIEAVAETIAEELLANYMNVQACTIKVTKPNPPIPGHYHSVAVEITRIRK
ncbi:dihydroneopterin aldolase [Bacillus kwashiorkori]|uniref:dihydroneopterin aldolase n=1 Tax=Bacillus kwashiorkori TaxID=1522318 RepID=UPI0007864561|nr:dihydroneopterin aldolase [Bacillus kwashiorkori]